MNILSIQSAVAYGHVGNSAAVFALQRLGHEVWPIDTVRFSNHPGHGSFRGRASSAAELDELVEGIAERSWLNEADALLTGYLGAADHGAVVARTWERIKAANPRAIWALDPVIGDKGRIFVKPGIPEFMRALGAPQADLLTPNAFELEYLSGKPCRRLDDALAAARALGGERAGRVVVATGLALDDLGGGVLTTLAVDGAAAWRVTTPAVPHPANGAGDLFSALFLGRYLSMRDTRQALEGATSAVHAVIVRSAAADARELLLVEAQEELVEPRHRFKAIAVR
jgi:pyridoxine kinase